MRGLSFRASVASFNAYQAFWNFMFPMARLNLTASLMAASLFAGHEFGFTLTIAIGLVPLRGALTASPYFVFANDPPRIDFPIV
jgi:hypothetical protein